MISTFAIIIALTGQANVGVAPASAAAQHAEEEVPSEFASLRDAMGAKAFGHLTHDADQFWMQLRKIVANFDKRQIEFKPDRPPKLVKQRLNEFSTAYTKAAGNDESSTHAAMLAMCLWRIDAERARLDADLAKSRRGLGALKTVLANLKALEVDAHAHYPVNVTYIKINEEGQLENARESYANLGELKAARQRIEKMVPKLVDFAEKRVNGLNKDARAREVLSAGWDALRAASETEGS